RSSPAVSASSGLDNHASLPHSDFIPVPSVSSLRPPAVYSLPSLTYPDTSEELRGWNTTDTSLKRKNKDTPDLDAFPEANAKRTRLLETSRPDAISTQKAKSNASLERLESEGVEAVRRTRSYVPANGGTGGPVVGTNKWVDENRQLREEVERLKGMMENKLLREEI
ncbi:hypothetical protein V5O48_013220, partial [Marasmius crinis-equi]